MPTDAPLRIDPTLQPVLLEEVERFAASLPGSEARARYLDLHEALTSGELDSASRGPLGTVLEVILQTGRARRVHGPQAEQSLLRLFAQTERGAAIRKATQAVNEALVALHGQQLEDIKFSATLPGTYRLVIDTDQCEVTIEINPEGVWVENVALGV